MSLRSVPGFSVLVSLGSPNRKGALPLLQEESSKASCRHASPGTEASANPRINRQVEFNCTNVVRESRLKLQVAPGPVRLNGIGGPVSPKSAMPWLVAHVMLTVPEAG